MDRVEVVARHRYARSSARKLRLVADQIRGRVVPAVLRELSFSPRRAARLVRKVLESAVANAGHGRGLQPEELRVSRIYVDEGPRARRLSPRAKGRADHILRRSSHITVILSGHRS